MRVARQARGAVLETVTDTGTGVREVPGRRNHGDGAETRTASAVGAKMRRVSGRSGWTEMSLAVWVAGLVCIRTAQQDLCGDPVWALGEAVDVTQGGDCYADRAARTVLFRGQAHVVDVGPLWAEPLRGFAEMAVDSGDLPNVGGLGSRSDRVRSCPSSCDGGVTAWERSISKPRNAVLLAAARWIRGRTFQ